MIYSKSSVILPRLETTRLRRSNISELETVATMHSLSNSLFGSQENYWRGSGLNGPYSSLQPLSAMPGSLPNSAYSPYDQYSSHHAVTSR